MDTNEQKARELLAAEYAKAYAEPFGAPIDSHAIAVRVIAKALAHQVPADGDGYRLAWEHLAANSYDHHTPYMVCIPTDEWKAAEAMLAATPQAPQPVVDATIGQQAVDDDAEMAQQAADEVNPAWWRGNDAAVAILCQKIHAILDGKDDGRGVANEPWESTRRRLLASQPQQGAVAWYVQDEESTEVVFSAATARERAALLNCGECKIYPLYIHPSTIGQQAVDDAELAEFVRGIYQRMNESYEGGRRILFQDMDYLFDFATKRRIILSRAPAALAAHGKPNDQVQPRREAASA